MKRYVPQMLLAALCIVGAMVTMVGCDDQAQASDNLLTNPGAMKYAANSVKSFFTPVNVSDETVPVRELLQQQTAPVRGQYFHQKVPAHSDRVWMDHVAATSAYTDGSGLTWVHVTSGAWASYYSTDPNGPPPTTQFHDVRGPTATTWRDRWHISRGPEASNYYNPSPGIDSMWVHIPDNQLDGSLYKPKGTSHIPTGANASLYAVPAISDTVISDTATEGHTLR
jgi:hypothetical protein